MALMISIAVLLIDNRIMALARMYRTITIEIASKIGAENLLSIHHGAADRELSLNVLFKVMGMLVISFWLISI